MTIIRDGAGNGYQAQVSSINRLLTDSVTTPVFAERSDTNGDAYVAITDHVSMTTTDTETGNLYIKNTGTRNILVHSIRTCGTVVSLWKMYTNSTTGTLISAATDAYVNNLNLSSNNVSTVNAYRGVNGSTVTNGTFFEQWINGTGHSEEFFNGALIISPQKSIALTVEVATAGTICTRLIYYYGS